MFGLIMPAPLAMPMSRTRSPSCSTSPQATLGKVSVVMMALAVSMAPADARLSPRAGMAAFQRFMRNCAPITPVEAGSRSSGPTPTALPAISMATRQLTSPSSPVQALAWPELITNPRRTGSFSSISRHWTTGAAGKRLVVKVPATTPGRSLRITPRSYLPSRLKPAMAAANE